MLLIAFNLGTAFAPITIALFQRMIPALENAGLFIGEGVVMAVLAVGALFIKNKEAAAITTKN